MARKRIEWTPEQISRALTLRFAGQTYDAIARDMGTSTSSVYRLFQERDENEDPEHLTPHEESLVASGIYQGRTPEDIALEIGKNARVVVECYKTLLKLCPGMEGGLEEGARYTFTPRQTQGEVWDDIYKSAFFEFKGWESGAVTKAVFRSPVGRYRVDFTPQQLGDYLLTRI
mgnify:CR=1 FL=1